MRWQSSHHALPGYCKEYRDFEGLFVAGKAMGTMMISVAIDGPGGAGKSTIARMAAKQLGFIYVDTGALYRAIGLYAVRAGVAPSDEKAVPGLLSEIEVVPQFVGGEQHVFLNGEDVSDAIRQPEISMAASQVSALPPVRDFLLELQRSFAEKYDVIMDGRDIGTVVLPNAQVKIFLTASPEVRAKRRVLQLEEKGTAADYDTVLRELKERDYQDSHRAIAPLRPSEDAVLLDTSNLTLEESIQAVIQTVKENI